MTTYHVTRNGQFATDAYEFMVAGRLAIQWVDDIQHASIMSRERAIQWAEKLGARAVSRTGSGRIHFVRSARLSPQGGAA